MLAWSDLLTPIRTDTKIYFSNKNIFEKYTFLKYSKGEKSLRKKTVSKALLTSISLAGNYSLLLVLLF